MTTIEKKLIEWQKELLQFDNRNRLLNFRYSSSRPSMIPVIAPSSEELFRQLVTGKKLNLIGTESEQPEEPDDLEAYELDEGPVESDLKPNLELYPDNLSTDPASHEIVLPELDTVTRSLQRGSVLSSLPDQKLATVAHRLAEKAHSSEQEQGISVLYATFGMVNWAEEEGIKEPRRSPLILLPLAITESARGTVFHLSANTAGDPEINLTLVERIKRDFGIDLGTEFDEEAPLAETFERIRSVIRVKPTWSVDEESYLGIFQFHKFRMFKDLSEHTTIAAGNEIVQALGLDSVTLRAQDDTFLSGEADLDGLVSPGESFSILDADSSQLSAIESVKKGGNLIISGPPGTGKSQTIANIIAECLVARKTILFVAEKSAALEVVYQRLASKGLDEFCLMLHSQKATKRDVIASLGARMGATRYSKAGPEEELGLKRLAETRQHLNAYATDLRSESNCFGKSASWVHGQLARLRAYPYLVAQPPSVESMKYEDFDRWIRQIESLKRHSATLQEGKAHPWAGLSLTEIGLSDRSRLRANLELLHASLNGILQNSAILADQLFQQRPASFVEVTRLLGLQSAIPNEFRPRAEWFEPDSLSFAGSLASQASEQARVVKECDAALLDYFSPAIFSLATDEVISVYEGSSFLGRVFSSSYRNQRAKVREVSVGQRQRDHKSELKALKSANSRNTAAMWFRENESNLRTKLGVSTVAEQLESDRYDQATEQILKTASVIESYSQANISDELVQALCGSNLAMKSLTSVQRIQRDLGEANSAITQLKSVFDETSLDIDGKPFDYAQLSKLNEWVTGKIARFDSLDSWLDARAEMKRVQQEGLESIAHALIKQNVKVVDWSESVRRLILTHWVDHVYSKSPALRDFRVESHEQIAESFRELDRQFVDASAARLRRTLVSGQTPLSVQSGGEPEILLREVGKQRRHLPIRKLFEKIPNLLPTLKPCLMMSPLSVAQFLSAEHYRFDVVIFDEASQIRPHDAIGAIMRGKQLIVAGDRKQLPPTSFFERQSDDSMPEDESSLKDMESILDALQAKNMPSSQLLWHYRSRHEDLIAFSNRHFYGDRLITFPTPSAERFSGRGVHFEYVPDGAYLDERDRVLKTPMKVNRIEAKRVANLVMDHARNRPDETLGVVALGTNQKGVVAEEIRQARLLDSSVEEFFREDRELPFFVKALEEVQGDERDVMIVGIGFGKGSDGRLSHNFGPINREGGERRLNVLITRAKHQVIVVSSIRASDIDLTRTHALGPRLLRQYLDFAERGTIALDAATTGGYGDYESPFEEEVGASLERAGFAVHRQIGCSKFRIDLAVIDPRAPGRYLLGIECDGATYHSSKTARDRDRLRQEILESLGWKIHRVWSTDWIRKPDNEFGRLLLRIEQELSTPISSSPERTRAASYAVGLKEQANLVVEVEQITSQTEQGIFSGAVPYIESEVSTSGHVDIFSAPVSGLLSTIVTCVDVESPIHHDVLIRRISQGWGYNRTGARIAEHLNLAIQRALKNDLVDKRGEFYWSIENNVVKVRGATAGGSLRAIDHIAGEEIIAAFTSVLERAMSLSDDELIQKTARLLGYQRTGADIQRRLNLMIQMALANEFLVSKNGRIVLVS